MRSTEFLGYTMQWSSMGLNGVNVMVKPSNREHRKPSVGILTSKLGPLSWRHSKICVGVLNMDDILSGPNGVVIHGTEWYGCPLGTIS